MLLPSNFHCIALLSRITPRDRAGSTAQHAFFIGIFQRSGIALQHFTNKTHQGSRDSIRIFKFAADRASDLSDSAMVAFLAFKEGIEALELAFLTAFTPYFLFLWGRGFGEGRRLGRLGKLEDCIRTRIRLV
jgi:hypothetical protein